MKDRQSNNTSASCNETATLAGGCFWCLEAIFPELKGVQNVVSGYTGGQEPNPSYREVCTGLTGHAEAVQISFDPREISYREILEVFFTIHDPTTVNQQGADRGTQYRSAIFFNSDMQKKASEELIQELDASGTWDNPIVTEIAPLQEFYPAEESHHDYYKRNSGEPYCRLVIEPKVAKLRKHFFDKLKK
jgi:peptide-methionine (S)-S-oxide reductase